MWPSLGESGRYADLFLGDPHILGHVDAPHASKALIPMTLLDRVLYSGEFLGKGTKVYKPLPHTLYAEQSIRRKLGIKGDTGTLQVGDVLFEVRQARRRADTSEACPLLCHPQDRPLLIPYLCNMLRSSAEARTGKIAKKCHEFGTSAIVATVNRTTADLNRLTLTEGGAGSLFPDIHEEAIVEYRSQKQKILEHCSILEAGGTTSKPYLHVALHGKKDKVAGSTRDTDIEIGTVYDESCKKEIREWFLGQLQTFLKGIDVLGRQVEVHSNVRFIGNLSLKKNRERYGSHYHSLQLEISKTLREKIWQQLAVHLSGVLKEFSSL